MTNSRNEPPLPHPHIRRPCGGFTMIEVVVAMVIFAIALTGLLPFMAILSRHLQPIKTNQDGTLAYRSTSPARDGNIDGTGIDPVPMFVKHTWYVTPYEDVWMRKMGASARLYQAAITSPTEPTPFSSYTTNIAAAVKNTMVCVEPNEATYNPAGEWSPYPTEDPTCFRIQALPNDGHTSYEGAHWILKAPEAGTYSIQATWPAVGDQVEDAVYNVYTTLNFKIVNQTVLPNDVQDKDGTWWEQIFLVTMTKDQEIDIFLLREREGTVEPHGLIAAGAVRMVQNKPEIISVVRSVDRANNNPSGVDVTAKLKVEVNLLQ